LIRGYDDWKLDTPDNHLKRVGLCECCGYEVYEGEDYDTDGLTYYHFECLPEEDENEEENEC
jgi:hypothetical protein